jgi:hypothetical protein
MKAIYCVSGCGPAFDDLFAYDEPFNGDNKCVCLANGYTYRIGADSSGRNLLSLSADEYGYFTISELEVWQLTY